MSKTVDEAGPPSQKGIFASAEPEPARGRVGTIEVYKQAESAHSNARMHGWGSNIKT